MTTTNETRILFLGYYVVLCLLFFPIGPSFLGILSFVWLFWFQKMGSSSSSHHALEYAPVVETQSGRVRGKVFRYDGKEIDGYLGIPYAQPPVGERRFKKPESIEPWTDTRDCVTFGPRCPQLDDFFAKRMNIVGTDEAGCLTLNVVAPRWKSQEWPNGLPVMVWIHGGGFAIHSSSNYGDATVARNLCTKDVVFVSLNYRLGVFGFFSTGDATSPGNLGLWDQTLALQWVRDNIGRFGGDPENVTIFGQSAGGASVDLLTLSPYSRDLFKRVIPMAGTAECHFAMRTGKDQASISRQFARFLGWKGEEEHDTEGMLRFMRAQPADKLYIDMAADHFKYEESGNLAFAPNLDGDFFPDTIDRMRRQVPRKDVLTGTTECEGLTLCFLVQEPYNLKGMKNILNLIVKPGEYGEEAENVKREVIDFYTKNKNVKKKRDMQLAHCQMFGDYTISNGTCKYAEKMAALGHTVYFYSFEYYNPDGFGLFRWLLPFRAASHITELRYLLGKGVVAKFKPNAEDLKMLHLTTTWFTNFAKYGNPNGKVENGAWEMHSPARPFRHYRIKLPHSEMMDNFQDRRAEFWYEKIYPRNRHLSKVY